MTTADRLAQLVDKSLVQSGGGPGRAPLPAARDGALVRRPRASTATAAAAGAIATPRYFAGRVDELGALVPGPDEDDAAHELSVELDDVHAAFEHAAGAGTSTRRPGSRRAAALAVDRGRPLGAPRAAGCGAPRHRGAPRVRRPARERGLGRGAGRRPVDGARARERRPGARRRPGVASTPVLDLAAGDRRLVRRGRRLLHRGCRCCAGKGDRAAESFLLGTAAIYRLAGGEEDRAVDAARRALTLAREIGSRSLRARAAGALSYALQDVDADAARRAAQEVLEVAPPGDFHLTMPHRVLAVLAWRDGDARPRPSTRRGPPS